ncbi:MotA/TolQ/ExbB proton channel family protein [bacterium]|nr:MotA/TolQ/ExbB proton channel family protein [bacterium]
MGFLLEKFKQGGPMMWPLLLLSLLALFIFFERMITYYKRKINTKEFLGMIIELLEKDDLDSALDLCEKTNGPIPAVLHEGLTKYSDLQKVSTLKVKSQEKRDMIEKTMEAAAAVELSSLEKGLVWLATVVSLAPIFGFLGTVTGMIGAFGSMATAGLGDPTIVAGGISEALVTTATGLIISAPALIMYNFFVNFLDRFTMDIQESSSVLLEVLEEMELTK